MDYKSAETQEMHRGHLPPRSILPSSSHLVNREKPPVVVMTFSGSPKLTCGNRRLKELVIEPKDKPKITRVTGSTTDHMAGVVHHIAAPSFMSTKPRKCVQLLSNDDSIQLAQPKKKQKKNINDNINKAPAASPRPRSTQKIAPATSSRPIPRPTQKKNNNHAGEPKLKKMFKKMLIVRVQEKKIEEEARQRRVEEATVQRKKSIQLEREASRQKLEKMEKDAAVENLFPVGVQLPPHLQFLK